MKVHVHSDRNMRLSEKTLDAIATIADLLWLAERFPEIRPWEPAYRAPLCVPLEGWVKRADGVQYRLPFPIYRGEIITGHSDTGLWCNAWSDEVLAVTPSHWRYWHGRF